MNDVTEGRVGHFTMRIIGNHRFTRGGHLAAQYPIIAAGLTNQIDRHPCRGDRSEKSSIRFDDFRLWECAAAAGRYTSKYFLPDDIDVQTGRNLEVIPRIGCSEPVGLCDTASRDAACQPKLAGSVGEDPLVSAQ